MPAVTPRLSMFRTAAKYLTEPHPYGRKPVTVASHSVPWNVYAKHVGRTGAVYVPWFAMVLGWPLAAAKRNQIMGMSAEQKRADSKEIAELILNMRWDD